MTMDEERGEMFVTIQHDGAIQVYPKTAKGDEDAIRLIQGNKTRLADPHGIAFDPKTRLLYIANYGTERDEDVRRRCSRCRIRSTRFSRAGAQRRGGPTGPPATSITPTAAKSCSASGKFGPPIDHRAFGRRQRQRRARCA